MRTKNNIPKLWATDVKTKTCTWMFLTAVITIAKK